jgi:transposase-like protein
MATQGPGLWIWRHCGTCALWVEHEPGGGWGYRLALKRGNAAMVTEVRWLSQIAPPERLPLRHPRRRTPPDYVYAAAAALHRGLKRREIAERFGIEKRIVTKWLKQAERRGLSRERRLTNAGAQMLRESGRDAVAILNWWTAAQR